MHIGCLFQRLGIVAVVVCSLIFTDISLANSGEYVYCGMSRAKYGHS